MVFDPCLPFRWEVPQQGLSRPFCSMEAGKGHLPACSCFLTYRTEIVPYPMTVPKPFEFDCHLFFAASRARDIGLCIEENTVTSKP